LKQVAEVTILGQQYTFKSDTDPKAIEQVADFVNERIDEVISSGYTADTLGAAVLALMNVAGEYLQLRDGNEAVQVQQRLEKLLARLEDIVPS
jgi:cell division protein ZapA